VDNKPIYCNILYSNILYSSIYVRVYNSLNKRIIIINQ